MQAVKISKKGKFQYVCLPEGFQFDVSEVEIFRRGDEIVLREKPKNLARVFDLLTGMSDYFMKEGREQPPIQKRNF